MCLIAWGSWTGPSFVGVSVGPSSVGDGIIPVDGSPLGAQLLVVLSRTVHLAYCLFQL